MQQIGSLQHICSAYIAQNVLQFLPISEAARELIDAQNYYIDHTMKINLRKYYYFAVDWICDNVKISGFFDYEYYKKLKKFYDGFESKIFLDENNNIEICDGTFIVKSGWINVSLSKSRGMQLLRETLEIFEKVKLAREFYCNHRDTRNLSKIRAMVSRKFDIPITLLI